MNNFDEYVPLGDEWKAEMNKWNKKHLIEFLAKNLAEKSELKSELVIIDEALARRPALDKYKTRYDKICAVCKKAQEAENIRR